MNARSARHHCWCHVPISAVLVGVDSFDRIDPIGWHAPLVPIVPVVPRVPRVPVVGIDPIGWHAPLVPIDPAVSGVVSDWSRPMNRPRWIHSDAHGAVVASGPARC